MSSSPVGGCWHQSLSAWLLGVAVLLIKFGQHTFELVTHVLMTGDDPIMGVLALIDLTLMGSLVVMVMFAGYENSTLDLAGHEDKPG
jgi:uncharacterized protein (TIGR00645 family)